VSKREFQIRIVVNVMGAQLRRFFDLSESDRADLRLLARRNILPDANAYRPERTESPWHGWLDVEGVSRMPSTTTVDRLFQDAIDDFNENQPRGGLVLRKQASGLATFALDVQDRDEFVRKVALPAAADNVGYTCIRYEVVDGKVIAVYNQQLALQDGSGGVSPFDGGSGGVEAAYHLTLTVNSADAEPSPPESTIDAPSSTGVLVDIWHEDVAAYRAVLDGGRFEMRSDSRRRLMPRRLSDWEDFWRARHARVPVESGRLASLARVETWLDREITAHNEAGLFPLQLELVPRYGSLLDIAKDATSALKDGPPATMQAFGDTFLPALRARIQSQTTLRFEVADSEALATYYVDVVAHDADGEQVEPFSEETFARYASDATFLAFLRLRA